MAVNGAHLFVVGAGALTVQAYAHVAPPPPGTPGPNQTDVPVGSPVTYGVGDQFLVPYDVVALPRITNEGSEPAVALVVSLAVTGGAGIEDSLPGWGAVESLAVADVARAGPPLSTAGKLGAEPIAVVLERVTYERGASLDVIWVDPAVRLLAIESGALNVLVIDPAFYTAADAAPQQLRATARVSPVPGDLLLVPAPGRIATRNIARGPSTVLVVTVGTVPAAAGQG